MKPVSREQYEKVISMLGDHFSGKKSHFDPDEITLLAETHLKPFCAYLSSLGQGNCPEEILRECRMVSIGQLSQKLGKERLFDLLESRQIPFVPLKGIDLAFRVYPEPMLRHFCDWDLWVRPQDLKRFLRVLKEDGWKCPVDAYSYHHCGLRIKGMYCIEPHFSLPNFPGVTSEELWEMTEALPGKKYQRQLSAELNLMMLFQHNAIDHFQFTDIFKTLLDFEFLLRFSPPDWGVIAQRSSQWRIPHPGLLIAAFPEFFQGRYSPRISPSQTTVETLRKLLLNPRCFIPETGKVHLEDAKWTSLTWWKKNLRRSSLENMRWKYPALRQRKWSYPAFLIYDIARKIAMLLSHRRMPPPLQEHLQMAKVIEESWKESHEN